MTFHAASTKILGVGSLVFGVWGLASPRSLTKAMGDDPANGVKLGLRDSTVGLCLLAKPGAGSLALRIASDVHDAYRLRERSPRVALGAAGFAVWGVLALVAVTSANRRWEDGGETAW